MNLKFLLAAALVASTSPTIAENATTVFGLPLGGKFEAPKQICSASDDASTPAPRKFCWVERNNYNGSYSGGIHLPNDKNLPLWALYSRLSVSVGKDGVLNSIGVRTTDEAAADEIVKSISSRFGPATSSHTLSNGRVIEWRGQGIDITIQCHRNGCTTNFLSAAERSRRAIDSASRKVIDAARPASP